MSRVVVAMSGGVDSSVAAALAQEAGHEAVGVTLKLLPRLDTGFGCCGSPKDIEDAKRVCERLGIPHYTMDLAALFEETVVSPFVESYLKAETPNPCVECNRSVKFHVLLRLAKAWGAEQLATGHYARVRGGSGDFRLLKAVDEAKDQSYFLYMLGQAELARALFPVGELTKTQVRQTARALGLETAEKKESYEICFVPGRDYRAFVAARAGDSSGQRSGDIVDRDGRVLGRHRGLSNYTVGQREGLGLAVGRPQYVVGLDPAGNRLVVGAKEEALSGDFEVERVSWTRAPAPPRVQVKVRYRARPAAAALEASGEGRVRVRLDEPQFAPAPGQSAVFYDGEEVLGGGVIAARAPAGAAA